MSMILLAAIKDREEQRKRAALAAIRRERALRGWETRRARARAAVSDK